MSCSQGPRQRLQDRPPGGVRARCRESEFPHREEPPTRDDQRPFEGVLELPDIARPRVETNQEISGWLELWTLLLWTLLTAVMIMPWTDGARGRFPFLSLKDLG